MKIGYVRISTTVQLEGYSLDEQKRRLTEDGCEKIYEDVQSGAKKNRPGLDSMIENLRQGDVVVVCKLDRLGRSLNNLLELLTIFEDRDVQFISLDQSINTSTPYGRMAFNMLAVIAEFERELIHERTQAGIAQARKKGVKFGAPSKIDRKMVERAARLYWTEDISSKEAAAVLGVARSTYYRLIQQAKDLGLMDENRLM